MHMKYFQALADIKNHYDTILQVIKSSSEYDSMLLYSWGFMPSEEKEIIEERDVLRYLVACQTMLTHDTRVCKPSPEVVERCFNRHIRFLDNIHNCNVTNVNKHPSVLVRKEYKACRHYLFQFSLPGWVEKMPDEILTYEERYGS